MGCTTTYRNRVDGRNNMKQFHSRSMEFHETVPKTTAELPDAYKRQETAPPTIGRPTAPNVATVAPYSALLSASPFSALSLHPSR